MFDAQQAEEPQGETAMDIALRMTGERVWKTSKEFDLNTVGQHTVLDDCIENEILTKKLESDSLLFVEGDISQTSPNFITKQEFINERRKTENWENISAGDFEDEMQEKLEEINERQQTEIGWIEK